jgi:hypothetical protein
MELKVNQLVMVSGELSGTGILACPSTAGAQEANNNNDTVSK